VLEFPLPSSCLFFLHFLPPCNIFLLLWLFFNRKYPSGSSSCQVQLQLYFRLHRLQLSSTFFQVQLLTVLQDFSGFNCLLQTINLNFYLYFRTSQASIVFYQLPSSIVSCTSRLIRLQLISTIFLIFLFQFLRLLFSEFFFVINIYLLSLSNSLSIKNLAEFIFNY
jgi:hypothetical protein